MRLLDVFKNTGIKVEKDIDIKGIEIDSRNVKENYIFFAIKGEKTDGNNFIDDAIKRGASVIVSEKDIKRDDAIIIKTNDILKKLAISSSNFYGNPSSKLTVFGITGTKGKTSVSFFLEQLLNTLNIPSGVIGTINYRTPLRIIMEAPNTTPYPPLLDKIIQDMLNDNCKACIMEVSSHALKLKKVDAVEFDVAIFTNISSDHLDFHKTIDDYKESKLRLFKLLEESKKTNKHAVINIDDEYSNKIKKLLKKSNIITYGIKSNAMLRASNIKTNISSTDFEIIFKTKKLKLTTNLIGIYNVYNILASIGSAYAILGEEKIDEIVEKAKNLRSVKGRLEKIESPKGFCVYIDYAHTENSLREVLKTLKMLPHKRIITVFGCGGDRDKTKRPLMGKVAAMLSDFVIITSDNPRTEDPIKIIDDIEIGIKESKTKNYIKIPDRKKAIRYAIEIAEKNDIVLIAGKGHEEYQIIGNTKVPFSDRDEVIQAINLTKG